jgi:hypothetical protein
MTKSSYIKERAVLLPWNYISVGMLQLTSGYFTAKENDYLTSICKG